MSLESLTLLGWPKLKCLPNQLRHLTSLRTLQICGFEGLEALLEWLRYFSSLESLRLYKCRNLTSLPLPEKLQLLKNLQSLVIAQCPLLTKRCQEGEKPGTRLLISTIGSLARLTVCSAILFHRDKPMEVPCQPSFLVYGMSGGNGRTAVMTPREKCH